MADESNLQAKIDLDQAESKLHVAETSGTVELAVFRLTEAYQHIVAARKWIERARNLKILDRSILLTLHRAESTYERLRQEIQLRSSSRVEPDFPESMYSPEKTPGHVIVKWWPLPITEPSSPGFVLQTMFAEEEIALLMGIRRSDVKGLKSKPESTSSIVAQIASTLPPRHHYTLSNWKEPERSMFWHPEGYAQWVIADCIGYALRSLLQQGIRPQFRTVQDEEAVKRYIRNDCGFYERPMSQPEAGRILDMPGLSDRAAWTTSLKILRQHYRFLLDTLDPDEAPDEVSMAAIAEERVRIQKAFYRILAERYLRVNKTPYLSKIDNEEFPLASDDRAFVGAVVKQLLAERCVKELRRGGTLILKPTGTEVERCVRQQAKELADLHLQLGQSPVV